ncbi:MAG: ribosomal subunit interface protein [Sulfurimonas sp. RIFOXYD12_FULL_33_39]|uniref:ribosome hibernation-promoting factor, HPF/YfiA family n=1 Tax=unclassified Sulfurimonas TaxID=2623549 RepID=UPI0008CEA1D7|nr:MULTISPECIES: ribosome-associated translation inhibitor RaiA [unclassified Sulfurimonas]OHE02307.1 MAG: ribosomal subunit interface protein [Sulfurimonas sp. RIFCSPLOWO2_12_FULL_34_6]OHE10476.1 MAG: ribosomal subunit interface protein [Sulfurimonas sp. RIFOXYD12_FULL_33_39]OHE14935.1 MAG: ribosomal subunit interface protein [Sulfurimonas sp. RIFOXYD2_FULL_34_21]DAB28225.1 MAG TPA: ribosomal subunit interface protein [Sulfurimonas sp. UBA10385]
MNVQIHAKDVTLHANTRSHIEVAIEAFKKYSLDITTVNVNLKKEKNGVSVEFDIHIAHAQPVVINQGDEDLDTAIDLAIDRATKALRRLHDKVISHQGASIKDMETAEV